MNKRITFIIISLCLVIFAHAQSDGFTISTISDSIRQRITGKSYKAGAKVPLDDLRYLQVLHCDKNGDTRRGELICHKNIADDLIDIFKELYQYGYRIERLALVDEYDADDEKSMKANNSSCFNYRTVQGAKKLSKHSQGLAVDINPLFNPCITIRTGKIEPATGKPYAYNRKNKSKSSLQMIDRNDLCYKLFIKHGFRWGGAWKSKKDYQHFEK